MLDLIFYGNMGKDIVPFWEKACQEYDTVAFSIELNATVTEFEIRVVNPINFVSEARRKYGVIEFIREISTQVRFG